jgi:hypothetical protein
MPDQQVYNHQVNQRYQIEFEKAASANKTDGFKVKANGDDIEQTIKEARKLYAEALAEVEKNKPVTPAPVVK